MSWDKVDESYTLIVMHTDTDTLTHAHIFACVCVCVSSSINIIVLCSRPPSLNSPLNMIRIKRFLVSFCFSPNFPFLCRSFCLFYFFNWFLISVVFLFLCFTLFLCYFSKFLYVYLVYFSLVFPSYSWGSSFRYHFFNSCFFSLSFFQLLLLKSFVFFLNCILENIRQVSFIFSRFVFNSP